MTQAATNVDDPFDCFDSDTDENDEGASDDKKASPKTATTVVARDPLCGVLAFHRGTEQSLYNYVEREVEVYQDTTSSTPSSMRVLQCIDRFCYTRHWMMHCGDEKAATIKSFLQEFCQYYQKNPTQDPWLFVELGTYCGYSAILTAQTILELNPSAKFQIVSVDVDPNHQRVARKLIQLANLQDYVSLIRLPVNSPEENLLTNSLRDHFQSTFPTTPVHHQIKFLFIDHDKDLYVSDLKQLEASGWICNGTHVAADNVIFFDIPYRKYIQRRKEQGIVSSRLVEGRIEYSKSEEGTNSTDFKDGIELTVYLEDPPTELEEAEDK